MRGAWRHRCGIVLPRSRGWDSDRPPLLPPLAGRELRPAPSPPRAGDGRDGGNCRRLVVPVAMPRAPTPALPRVAGEGACARSFPRLRGGSRHLLSFPRLRGKVGMGGDRRRGAARCVWYLRPLPGFVPVTMLQTSHRVLRACVLLLSAFLLSSCAGHPQPGESQAAGDGATTRAGAAHTGEYPNLFVEAGYPRDVVDARIEAAFAQLFHGDPDSEAVYYEAGGNEHGPLAYIHDVNSDDVRSEGMSYGMMIAVQMDRKREFDAIWNWALTHMYHDDPGHPAYGYFAWSVRTDGTAIDEMPAP